MLTKRGTVFVPSLGCVLGVRAGLCVCACVSVFVCMLARARERRERSRSTRLVSAVMMPSSGQRTKSPNVFAKHFYTKTYQIQSSLINAIDISFTKERKKEKYYSK